MKNSDQSLRLLIVENEVLIAMWLEAKAQEAGWVPVRPDLNLAQAEHLAMTAELDGAVLDINPRECAVSLQVAATLRERGIPFIFMTSHGFRAQGWLGFEGVPVLHKPFGHEQFVAAVRAHLVKEVDR
jgi:DNA-binding response OmpR family regulator